MVDLLLAVI